MWTTKKNPTSSEELHENWKSQIVGRNPRIIAHWWTLCEYCTLAYFNLHLFRIFNKFHHLSWTLSVTGVIITFLCNFIWEATCQRNTWFFYFTEIEHYVFVGMSIWYNRWLFNTFLCWKKTWIHFHFFCLGFFPWGQGSHTNIMEVKKVCDVRKYCLESIYSISLETFHRK